MVSVPEPSWMPIVSFTEGFGTADLIEAKAPLRDRAIAYGIALGATGESDGHCACFDKLSMRFFLLAMKKKPHPEPVEG